MTTAIGRPNYADLALYVFVDTTASPTTITLGNSAVKRYKAVNLDASAEYYLPSQGVLSIGLFYKHIDNRSTRNRCPIRRQLRWTDLCRRQYNPVD